ncbi:hypothetical protein BDZ89DRAFT_1073245, partial [Hymenopellis radicata]
MRLSTLYVMLFALSISFVMSAPTDDNAPGNDKNNDKNGGKNDGKDGGKNNGDDKNNGNSKDGKCRRSTKPIKRDVLLEARLSLPTFLGGGKAAGTFCGIIEKKNSRPKDCTKHKFTGGDNEDDGQNDNDSAAKRAEDDNGGGDEVKYTPLSKALGTKQISRLNKELSGLKRKATGSGLTCDYPVEVQVMDLVLFENDVCEALDDLAGVIEKTAAKKNDLKLEWMTDAIKVATSQDQNFWEVPKPVYAAKKQITTAVISGKANSPVKVKGSAEDLQSYLGEAGDGVEAFATALSEKVMAALQTAQSEAQACAESAAEKKKVTSAMKKAGKAKPNISDGVRKYFQESVQAAEEAKGTGSNSDSDSDKDGSGDGDDGDSSDGGDSDSGSDGDDNSNSDGGDDGNSDDDDSQDEDQADDDGNPSIGGGDGDDGGLV